MGSIALSIDILVDIINKKFNLGFKIATLNGYNAQNPYFRPF